MKTGGGVLGGRKNMGMWRRIRRDCTLIHIIFFLAIEVL